MATIIGKDQSMLKRETCYKCASIIEYSLSEVVAGYSTDYTGSKDMYKYVRCPCCGNEVTVKGY